VREVRVKQDQPHWTTNDTGQPVGLKITKTGLTAIAVGPDATDAEPAQDARAASTESAKGKPDTEGGVTRPGTKQALVVSLLKREQGATLADLVEATSWLPHTTRAALTGLRKKGFAVGKIRAEDGTTIYRLSSEKSSDAPVKH
jgi:hypothetical protein